MVITTEICPPPPLGGVLAAPTPAVGPVLVTGVVGLPVVEVAPCGVVTCWMPEGEVVPCVLPLGTVAPPPPIPVVGVADVVTTTGPWVGFVCEQGTAQSAGFDVPPAPGPPLAPGPPPALGALLGAGPPPAPGAPLGVVPPPAPGPPLAPVVRCSFVEIFKLISTSTPSGSISYVPAPTQQMEYITEITALNSGLYYWTKGPLNASAQEFEKNNKKSMHWTNSG